MISQLFCNLPAILLQRANLQQSHTMENRASYPLQIKVENYLADGSISVEQVATRTEMEM